MHLLRRAGKDPFSRDAFDYVSGSSPWQDELQRLEQDPEFIIWRDDTLAAEVTVELNRALEFTRAVFLMLAGTFLLAELLLPPKVDDLFKFVLEVVSIADRYNEWVRASVSLKFCMVYGGWRFAAAPGVIEAVAHALRVEAFGIWLELKGVMP